MRFPRGNLLNNIGLGNVHQKDWVLEADNKVRLITVTAPGEKTPYCIPYENVVCFRPTDQAAVMNKVLKKGGKG